MFQPILKFVASPIPEITGGTQKIWQFLDMPMLLFHQHFLWAFVPIGLLNVSMLLPNLKFVASSVPEITAIGVFGGVANPNLVEEEALGVRGWYCSKARW